MNDVGSRPDLYLRPLFYDALSGEFTPFTDPEKRHTLGRLLVGTYLRGEIEVLNEDDAPYEKYIYTPSWAGQISVSLTCEYGSSDNQQIRTAWGLWMRNSENQNYLNVVDGQTGQIEEMHIGTNVDGIDADCYHELVLGPKIALAREAATEAARKFFNQ